MKKFAKVLVAVACIGMGMLRTPPASADELPLEAKSCGDVVTHSFRLSKSMVCPVGNGLEIGKAGITVDLNGFMILGNQDGIGIENVDQFPQIGFDDVTVRNGVVRAFGLGIDAVEVDRNTFSKLVVVDSAGQGFQIIGKDHLLSKNTVVASGLWAIRAFGSGITMTKNRVSNTAETADAAVRVEGDQQTFDANTVTGNADVGVQVFGSKNSITGNKILGNGFAGTGSPGLLMDASSDHNVVEGNVLSGNSDDGYRDNGTKNTAVANEANGNGYFAGDSNGVGTGIDASAATDPKGTGNHSLGNDASTQCVASNGAALCSPSLGDPTLPLITPPCGSKIFVSFRLGADRTCTGHGFVVATGGITIDLNGHTIKGDGGADDFGIVNDSTMPGSGFDDVTIKNGAVRNFAQGVRIAEVNHNTVAKIVSVDATHGFFLRGTGHALKKSTAVANEEAGIVTASAIGGTFEENTIVNNDLGAQFNNLSNENIFSGNQFAGNRDQGLYIGGNKNELTGNVFSGNGISNGVAGVTDDGLGNVLTKNKFFGNGGTGFSDTGAATKLNKNKSFANGYLAAASDANGHGFDADVAFVTGAGNKVLGNDSPMGECTPASICA